MNQLNLTIRFILEMAMIVVSALWGWNNSDGIFKFVLAIGIPLVLAALWEIFAVKDDPSRSGKTVIQTPGVIRLIMELAFLGFACWALFDLGYRILSLIMTILVFGHYIFSIDRIRWLLNKK